MRLSFLVSLLILSFVIPFYGVLGVRDERSGVSRKRARPPSQALAPSPKRFKPEEYNLIKALLAPDQLLEGQMTLPNELRLMIAAHLSSDERLQGRLVSREGNLLMMDPQFLPAYQWRCFQRRSSFKDVYLFQENKREMRGEIILRPSLPLGVSFRDGLSYWQRAVHSLITLRSHAFIFNRPAYIQGGEEGFFYPEYWSVKGEATTQNLIKPRQVYFYHSLRFLVTQDPEHRYRWGMISQALLLMLGGHLPSFMTKARMASMAGYLFNDLVAAGLILMEGTPWGQKRALRSPDRLIFTSEISPLVGQNSIFISPQDFMAEMNRRRALEEDGFWTIPAAAGQPRG